MNGKRGKSVCRAVDMKSKRALLNLGDIPAWPCPDGNGLAEKEKVVM